MIYAVNLSDDLAERVAALALKEAQAPAELAQTQIILPTRRACLVVKEAFLRLSQEKPLLLPRLMPLYEPEILDEQIPQAMEPLERTLLLARLCLKQPSVATPDKALQIALGLGELLDEFYQFETDTAGLEALVDEERFAAHWNDTLAFLHIIRQTWPQVLAERGQIDAADRRMRLINALAQRLTVSPPRSPVILAGVNGDLPSVRRLAKAVDACAKGFVLLDGVDTLLSAESFNNLPENHWQYPFKRLLSFLKLQPADLPVLPMQTTPQEPLVRTAFKPLSETHEWREIHLDPACAQRVHYIECPTRAQEALTIALLLREVLETPARTAALVTPDRELARRVIAEMKRWGVALNDSAGCPLTQTEPGHFLNLIGALGIQQQDSALLALLKHPLAAAGQTPAVLRARVRQIELAARLREKPCDWGELAQLTQPFAAFFTANVLTPFKTLLEAHIAAATKLATSADRSGEERLWGNEAGKTALAFLTQLMEKADLLGEIEPLLYPAALAMLMENVPVRPRYGMHPRLRILGPIEARFHHADVCILGGLNDGVFPAFPETGPWLNRQMRAALGFPDLESKIGVAAMDFAHCFCGRSVYLTRALKAEGAATIPSRFIARLEAVLEAAGMAFPTAPAAAYADRLNRPEQKEEAARPAPCPPLEARPRRLSVTQIELWMRNPYAIYARHILRLKPLPEMDLLLKNKLYGQAVHQALEDFFNLPPDERTAAGFISRGQACFAALGADAIDCAFYMPRLAHTARFVAEQDAAERPQLAQTLPEQAGEIILKASGGDFTLVGRADRIDRFSDGALRIVDYKTRNVPTQKSVSAGFSPQLPLEGLILREGGFPKAAGVPAELAYWKLPSREGNGRVLQLSQNSPIAGLIALYEKKLLELIAVFSDAKKPYDVCPEPSLSPDYDDYAHLARAPEWMHADDEKDEKGED